MATHAGMGGQMKIFIIIYLIPFLVNEVMPGGFIIPQEA